MTCYHVMSSWITESLKPLFLTSGLFSYETQKFPLSFKFELGVMFLISKKFSLIFSLSFNVSSKKEG